MSLREVTKLANSSGLAKNDTQWWPKSMEAYARSVHQVDAPPIDISRERLISLFRRMRDSGKSAWVRLEVVRAVMKSTEVPRSASLEHAQTVGCDKQRAGTPIYRHGVPALALVTPYKSTNWPAVS